MGRVRPRGMAGRRRTAFELLRVYAFHIVRGQLRYSLSASDLARSFRPWWRSNRVHLEHEPIGDRQPWLTYAALRHLDSRVGSDQRVFEYGVGGSTLYFLDRAARLVSVDHDPAWASAVREAVGGDWDLRILPPQDATDIHYQSHRIKGSFREYAASIDDYGEFDIILVDGRARSACLRHAASHVAPGGMLVLDNSERAIYSEAAGEIDRLGWQRTDYFGPGPYNLFFWQTTIWSRPG